METELTTSTSENATESARRILNEADHYVRENPIPTVIGALAVGFALGLLVRATAEPESRADRIRDRLRLDDAEDYLRSVLEPLAKRSKRAYRRSSDAVRDAVEAAVDRARDVDVEDYTDPVVNWWQRVWKKCCG